MGARKFFVGGNWKCNGTVKSVESLVDTLNNGTVPGADVVEVVVAPTAVHIPLVQSSLRKDFAIAAQNAWVKGSGAYTGELSAEILTDLGIPWVILGHSERRALIGESSELIADKTKYCLDKGLGVILCIGESLEEREAGKTFEVVAGQLAPVAEKISDWSKVVVAYEPVWAIGTGKVASPEQAQETHAQIRAWLAEKVSADVAGATRIIYGGSVSASNSDTLATEKDIDGFLVGGASLKPDFLKVINSATKA
ncbi:g10566 [Coccomyxa elongata]